MSTWTPKNGCPGTIRREYTGGEYAVIGAPAITAEITAADGVLYWALFILDDRRRGRLDNRCIARGISADVPTARPVLKARITRLAMAHVRRQLDHAIATSIEALAVDVAAHEGIAAAAADLDLADARALVEWDREREAAAAAADAAAARLASLIKLAPNPV
jgi:hypothetical protein